MRFRAKNTRDSAQGYIQCTKCIGKPVVQTDGRSPDYSTAQKEITTLLRDAILISRDESLVSREVKEYCKY